MVDWHRFETSNKGTKKRNGDAKPPSGEEE